VFWRGGEKGRGGPSWLWCTGERQKAKSTGLAHVGQAIISTPTSARETSLDLEGAGKRREEGRGRGRKRKRGKENDDDNNDDDDDHDDDDDDDDDDEDEGSRPI